LADDHATVYTIRILTYAVREKIPNIIGAPRSHLRKFYSVRNLFHLFSTNHIFTIRQAPNFTYNLRSNMVKRICIVLAIIINGFGSAGLTPLPDPALAQSNTAVLVGAGDIASCSYTQDQATAKLLDRIGGTVFTVGDNVYTDGALEEFEECYDPTWGRHKQRTRPSPGNHDYDTSGAAGYYTYFGRAATPLEPKCTRNCKGYYSYNLGAWHIIVLNSEISMDTGSEQEKWLRADLAANRRTCTLAYWHRPLFSSGSHGNDRDAKPIWEALYEYRADVVLNGHDHLYERFAPQDPSGEADPGRGIRQFTVGTGGAKLYKFSNIKPNSQVRNNKTWGVLKLVLQPTSYKWQFIPIAGKTFTDSGSSNCVGNGPAPSDLIFKDSFESGDLSAWSSSKTGGGDLRVSAAAAQAGNRGLQAVIDDNNSIYVTDNKPSGEWLYQARFYFDPNSIKMAGGNSHTIFQGYNGTSTPVLRVEFRFRNGKYEMRTALRDDGSGWKNSKWVTVSDASHLIRLTWRAAQSAGANNGRLTLWIDGAQKSDLNGVDNDTRRIDRIRLGAVAGIDSGTRGIYYFDAFKSWR
jgi:hypothetical protein